MKKPSETPKRHKTPRMRLVPRAPKVEVRVDQKTIDDSIRRNSSHCMIAEAVKKSVPYAKNVLVDLQSIRFTDYDRALRYSYLTPRHAQIALLEFDQGKKPKAFSITLVGASVRRAIQRPHGPRGDISLRLDERLRIVSEFQAARIARKASLEEIGDAIDVAPRSLEGYVSANPPVFSKLVGEKLAAWTEQRQGPGRPRAVPASLVSGTARLRVGGKGERSAPEVVAGQNPPMGNIARRRGFGLRSMVP